MEYSLNMNQKQQKIILPHQKTKIICTIGPASRSSETLSKMASFGMSVARLNFSHGSLEDHTQDIALLQKLAKTHNRIIPILVDLPGVKLRIGELEQEPLEFKQDDYVTFTSEITKGTSSLITIDYPEFYQKVTKGTRLYLNDGFIELQVEERTPTTVKTKVIIGGKIRSKKGMNIPDIRLFEESVTQHDLELIDFALAQGIRIFSVSYVQGKHDIEKVRDYAQDKGIPIAVIAKIECRGALDHFDEILETADGIMIARGDLGVEVPIEDVPSIQKRLIRKANAAGKPVITATQMLKSMTQHTRPTRAEATDVANAILDGSDAVMLSEETAIGQYPLETVKMMATIAATTEKNKIENGISCTLRDEIALSGNHKNLSVADVISLNVIEAHTILEPRFILVTTASGNTARRISRFKPTCWILAFSRNVDTCRMLPFSYGVIPFHLENPEKSWHERILRYIKEQDLVKQGDIVLLTQRRFARDLGGTDSFGVIRIE